MTTDAQRQDLKWLMELLINRARQCDYPRDDVRGFLDAATFALTREQAIAKLRSGGHLMFDCSAALTCVFKWAGLQDPNGLHYHHAGYTGTMLANLPHYANPAYANVGALVVLGPGTGSHVCSVLEPGRDPLLFSHGQRGYCGPIRLSAEARYHAGPVTFLSIVALGGEEV